MTARSLLLGREDDLVRLGAREIPFLAQVDVRVPGARAASLGFPLEPNTFSSANGREILWLGPDEWLVVDEPGDAATLVEELERSLEGSHHSIVDVSAGRAVIELRGPSRHELLASACPIDLHPRSWGDGMCAGSVFGSAQVLLQERTDDTRVFARPSFASYVLDLLLAALGTRPSR